MKFLVLDVNVLFSFFKRGKVFWLIEALVKKNVKLLVPTEIVEELVKLKHKILSSAKLSENEWEELLKLLFSVVENISKSKYEPFLSEGKRISPHIRDAPLFALSLAFNKAPIWSRELRLKRQKVVKILSDKDVENLVK
jgi:predicted nucleic acid-binding protein